MTLTWLEPGDSVAMGRWYDLVVAAGRHDLPDLPPAGRVEHAARFAWPWPGSAERVLLARDGERVAGAASCLLPEAGKPGVVHLELTVHPGCRGRGVGTGLLAEVCAVARRHRRSLIEVQAVRALPAGVVRDEAGYRYLTRRGHRPGVVNIRSRWEVSGPAGEWGHADGYSLVRWRDAAPEEIIEDVAALQTRFALDASAGDVAAGRERYDAGRMRAQEAAQRGRGYRTYSTAARHDASGRIVARTKLSFEADVDTHARQRITIVEPAHRGRRLGLIVKSANHAYARAHVPALRFVDAWNAEENTHMRAVNAALGFRPVDAWAVFQLPVPAA